MQKTESENKMEKAIMVCGCAAQGTVNGVPGCVIHGTTHPANEQPDLTGRVARCAYGCGSESPSDLKLAFFEYCGEGSDSSLKCGNCNYALIAHTQESSRTRFNVIEQGKCDGYTPRGDRGFDRFYCGCKGWD
jgi:hypothetical protein